ncbi:MAG: hypothetical protein J0H53_04755 [Rhizobiales bacterium]|nr:hypothetical protein [Hyphomicrobiales bacterium]OJU36780.1 MAG: hypothetical protein BGN94_20585 [Rhizobiales bacterium 68-8]
MSEKRRTVIAAGLIFIGFGLFAWFLPDIMLAAGNLSPWAAGVVVIVFLLGFFALFWVRSRYKDRG